MFSYTTYQTRYKFKRRHGIIHILVGSINLYFQINYINLKIINQLLYSYGNLMILITGQCLLNILIKPKDS
jgi:hypothetical protein